MEKEIIVVKADEGHHRIEATIENGQIKEVCDRRLDRWGKWTDYNSDCYTPEGDKFTFRSKLYRMIDIWEYDEDIKAKEEFFSYLSEEERERYFGKYGKPVIFWVYQDRRDYVPIKYLISILDGKIFEIEKYWTHPSWEERKNMREVDIKRELVTIVGLFLAREGREEYDKFLDCLCKEELEKYFEPSYLPKEMK